MTYEPPARAAPPEAGARARLAALLADVETGDPKGATTLTRSVGGGAPRPSPDPRPVSSSTPTRRNWRGVLRRTAFGSVLVLLVASIPALGYIGARTLRDSRAGQVLNPVTDPRAPGYTAIVAPTPTAVVVQRDAKDVPVALTVIALGAGEGGGTILFVPLDTLLPDPVVFTPDRLRLVHEVGGDLALVAAAASLLNITLDSVVDLSDDDWTRLVEPVAPLEIDNPDALDGFPVGRISLKAERVGPYLAAQGPGESDLNRLIRHQILWQAWLEAIGRSTSGQPVPDGPGDILGPIARTLAGGFANIDTLDVDPAPPRPHGAQLFTPNAAGVRDQVTEAVPYPVAPGIGSRYSVRLLNGVSGDPIPLEIFRRLVSGDAQISQIGNAKQFGASSTTIEYHDPVLKDRAEQVVKLLGGGRPVYNPKSNDAIDVIITLGRDAMKAADGAGGDAGGDGGN